MTYVQLADLFRKRYDKGGFHAAALYRAFFRDPHPDVRRLPAYQSSPCLADQVARELAFDPPEVVKTIRADDVSKFVLRLADSLTVEMVAITMANHTTLCLSSQVGCAMGCRFCRTGQMGLWRNLKAEEIVAQVYLAQVHMGMRLRNVVFMGMGEPLDNFEAVTHAIEVLSDQRGLDIAKRHMTLSTCGLVSGIRRLKLLNWPTLKLAVSLNAPNDRLRSALMPVNRRHGLAELKSALIDYPLAKGNALLFEYVLIEGVNDGPGHAAQLAAFLHGLNAKLNLIPYNPHRAAKDKAPSDEAVDRFRRRLIRHKIFVRLRASKGADILAACGQLGARGDRPSG